jgi:hypothetical protein
MRYNSLCVSFTLISNLSPYREKGVCSLVLSGEKAGERDNHADGGFLCVDGSPLRLTRRI